jgi:hypothetical protein
MAEETTETTEQESTGTESTGTTSTTEQTEEHPEVAKLKAALQKATGESISRKKALAELQKKYETDTERAQREATEAAAKDAEAKWKPRLVGATARAELAAAGFSGKNPAAMVKLLDLDALTVEDDGTISGLPAEIKRLRGEFPELFGKGSAAVDGAPKKSVDGSKKSSAERLAALAGLS